MKITAGVTLTAFALGLVAQPAAALSCLNPDLARSYSEAQESQQVYSVVLGQFSFDPVAPPFDGTPAPSTSIPARFDGQVLGPDGFNRNVSRDVVFEVSCVADTWCGSGGAPGDRVLAFLRHDSGDLVLDLNPCPQWLFTDPTAAQIELVGECFTGGSCE